MAPGSRRTSLDSAAVISRHICTDRRTTLALEAHIRTAEDPRISRINPQDRHNDELCVPLLVLKGDSYRLKGRDLGKVPGDGPDA